MVPDDATRYCLYQMMGYTMFSQKITAKDASLFILYGLGGNGKGTLQTIMTKIIGEPNVSCLDIAQVTAKFTSNLLDGCVVNFCSDATDKSSAETHIESGTLKAMATGEPIVVQRKNEKPYKMYNQAKLWFMSNSQPDLGGIDGGVLRRLHIIHMLHEFTVEDNIQATLYTTRAIQWLTYKCLCAYIDFLADNSTFADSPDMVQERVYYSTNNNIYDFLFNNYSTNKEVLLDMIDGKSCPELYAVYRTYSYDSGNRPFSNKKFYATLRADFKIGRIKQASVNSFGKNTTQDVFCPLAKKGAF